MDYERRPQEHRYSETDVSESEVSAVQRRTADEAFVVVLSIGHNIAALKAERALQNNSRELSSVFDRLSSGLRINRAADDAAGLAIAESLNADARVFSRAICNVNDGISAVTIADGAVEQLTGIVTRIRELATQAANGALSSAQRGALDEEAQALSEEYSRIVRSTEFNNLKLLNGSVDGIAVQAGYGTSGRVAYELGGNLPDGTFGEAAQYSLPDCYNIDACDIDGDGDLDLAGAGGGGGNGRVSIVLNNGDGTFASPVNYTQTFYSYAVVLADVNGDDKPDCLIAGENGGGQGNLTIRLGDGLGGFGSADVLTMDANSSGDLAVGDVNGDGKVDIATTGMNGANSVTFRLGNGDGTFQAPYSYDQGAASGDGCELVDLDGDGDLDVVTSGWYVGVRLNNGNGTFGGIATYTAVSAQDEAIAVGDLNGDGNMDIVAAGYAAGDQGYVAVLLGDGRGSFTAGRTYAAESDCSNGVALGDFNGDGMLDFATSGLNDDGSGWVSVRLGNGDGTFGEKTSYYSQSQESWDLAIGDFDGDTALDIASANFFNGDITIRLGNTGPGIAPLAAFDLSTAAGAREAFAVLDRQRDQLLEQRGIFGAFQSRLAAATCLLSQSVEDYRAAEGRIRHADIAEESSRLVKLQIMQQAGAAVMAQANQQPALVLQLLSG